MASKLSTSTVIFLFSMKIQHTLNLFSNIKELIEYSYPLNIGMPFIHRTFVTYLLIQSLQTHIIRLYMPTYNIIRTYASFVCRSRKHERQCLYIRHNVTFQSVPAFQTFLASGIVY